MDVSAAVLNKLLSEQNLDIFSKLKLSFLDPAYSTLYSIICRHYDKFGKVPSFADLELTIREGASSSLLSTIKLTEMPEVDSDIALNALIDQYTQTETIKLLENFVKLLPLCDTEEIKTNLANIALAIEEKTYTSSNVYSMNDLCIFHRSEEVLKDRFYLGFNNKFDAQLSGLAREELLVMGGKRGSGKSLVCSNIFVSQYEMGNTCIYFTIEMTAKEVNDRNMAILSNVSHTNVKKGTYTEADILKLAQSRANMFENGEEAFQKFLEHKDKYRLEEELMRNYHLKKTNQMIIVDDRNLTISAIDLALSKAKSKFGDSLGVVIVDYINQIVIEGNKDKYDWKSQIEIATKLKNMARKYEIVIISPYQIDDSGQTRFARGILDAPDIALLLDAHNKEDEAITFETTKIRGDSDLICTSHINWNTLRIFPQEIDKPGKKNKGGDHDSGNTEKEDAIDLPWKTE